MSDRRDNATSVISASVRSGGLPPTAAQGGSGHTSSLLEAPGGVIIATRRRHHFPTPNGCLSPLQTPKRPFRIRPAPATRQPGLNVREGSRPAVRGLATRLPPLWVESGCSGPVPRLPMLRFPPGQDARHVRLPPCRWTSVAGRRQRLPSAVPAALAGTCQQRRSVARAPRGAGRGLARAGRQ
jgi:hypothetical protein